MLKLLHFADAHFEKDKLDKCVASANFIVEKAGEIQPDLIVSAGDIFNRLQTLNSKSAVTAAKSFIMRLAEIAPVVMVKGNEQHDSAGCLEVFRDLDTRCPIFTTERAETIWLTNAGLFVPEQPTAPAALIHLLSYPEKAWFLADKPGLSIDESNALIQDEIRKIMLGFGAISAEAKCPVVFVGHMNVSGSVLSSGQTLLGQDILISKHDLALAGADYVALGHIHKAQTVGPNMFYAGSTYHNNFGEAETKAFNVVEMDEHNGGHAVIEHIVIPSRPLSLHEMTFENGQFIDQHCAEFDWTDADLRIRVHITKEQSVHFDDDYIKTMYINAHSYTIERIIQPEERIRSSEIVTARSLREKVTEWGRSIDRDISPEVLEVADETEKAVAQQ